MGKRILTIFAFAAVFIAAIFDVVQAQSKPWLQTYATVRTLYVSATGTGQGTTPTNPMSLGNAINSAQAGDLFWMGGGTYKGFYHLTRSGTSTKPIIFRATANQRVIINGSIEISGAYVWLWGLEVSDIGKTSSMDSGVRLLAQGIHLINNVIHHARENGIGAWSFGPGQVIYGNIVYENSAHNIYTQNDFTANGYKYAVDNVFMEQANVCSGCYIFHAYGTNVPVTGFHLERNVFRNGKFLMGGYGVPADREVIQQNYFYNVAVRIGWRRPTQVHFLNNYLGRADIMSYYFWGAGETKYTQTAPNVYTGNEMIRPRSRHIFFQTSAYLATGRCEGCPKIQATDTVNNNKYSAPFLGWFNANNTFLPAVNLTQWRNATAAAGKALDVNSIEIPVPTTSKVVLLKNDYDPTRGNLVIYNWGKTSTVTANLSSVVPSGSAYKIYNAKAMLGTPILSGTYSVPVSIPIAGQEFAVYIVQKL